jgi:tetratricopeptide (TPR) repeat protein
MADEQARLDASEPLFTVLAAANAVGYDSGLQTSPAIRAQIRDKIAATKAPILAELKVWFGEHSTGDKQRDLDRFISLGLSIDGAPDFKWSTREPDVPPEAKAWDSLREILPRFYEQCDIANLWRASQRAVETELSRYQEPVAKTLLELNAYLRNPTYGFLGRRFRVYIDFMAAPNQVQTRSFGDDYFVVITYSNDLKIPEIRHAYLRYLIDPLSIKYGVELQAKDSLEDIAVGAPLLREPYRSNFDLLASECLIKAIESRLLSNPSMVNQALREGYILTPFFNEQLALYEKSPEAMKLFFPEMIAALSVRHEIKRLENVEFAKEAPKETSKPAVAIVQVAPKSEAAAAAAKADDLYYGKQDLDSARKLYTHALELPGTPADHSLAYYGLAHIALKQRDPEGADQLFRKTIESSPAPDTQAWSYYYLGRLAVAANEHDEAVKWFNQAIGVPGAPEKAVESARKELAKPAPADKQN